MIYDFGDEIPSFINYFKKEAESFMNEYIAELELDFKFSYDIKFMQNIVLEFPNDVKSFGIDIF